MTTKTRAYVHNPAKPADFLTRLLNRGVVNVDLAKAVEQYAAEGVTRTEDQVANNVRAAIRMAGNQMFAGALDTKITGSKLRIELNGQPVAVPADSFPKVLSNMINNGKKVSPTIAAAVAAVGGPALPVNPQAKV